MNSTIIRTTAASADYELIDSGEGEKLERFGQFVLSRPDPQALWPKLRPQEWKRADAIFTREEKKGEWQLRAGMPEKWQIKFADLSFWIKPTAFKHTGLFPEQAANWMWMKDKIKMKSAKSKNNAPAKNKEGESGEIEVLNLFGYTGGATLACAQAGAKVTHVDSSKSAATWAGENAELSGLKDKPIRWIVDDAREFVRREIKRGRKYDAIIMDPPAFGHGPSAELWKIEDHFLALVAACKELLKPEPLFFLVNGYSAGYSPLAYENNLIDLKLKYGGTIEIGELALQENPVNGSHQARLLPAGIFASWSAE